MVRQKKLDWFLRLFFCSIIIGILSGISSAIFLYSLDWISTYRNQHHLIIYGLPMIGLMIGYLYHCTDKDLTRGSSFVIEEAQQPQKQIPFLLWPLILITTLLTHLFGGSAGREGTALQMGGSIGDSVAKKFSLPNHLRSPLILMGMAAGFGSLFGAPFAASLFAIEVLVLKRNTLWLLIPCLASALTANQTCLILQAKHTTYVVPQVPIFHLQYAGYAIALGILSGLLATLYIKAHSILDSFFKKTIAYPPLRPFFGGVLILVLIIVFEPWEYLGLSIPMLQDSFINAQPWYTCLLKLFFTTLTLSCGFKGGEVTPLFVIGATFGSALSLILPFDAPIYLLACIGFVAIFSGATNTPLACTLMGIELFHPTYALYLIIACLIAASVSTTHSVYTSQPVYPWKIFRTKKRTKEQQE